MTGSDLPRFDSLADDSDDDRDMPIERRSEPASIPGYEIERLIGRGGMGQVFRARDRKLGRTVAIKTLIPTGDPRRLERFADEARAIAGLHHPNIAEIYGSGDVDGVPYLVMEYLAGGTVAELPAERLSAPRVAARLGIVVASAIDHAHRQGIVHRDLKPSNLLLASAGNDSSDRLGARRGIEAGEPDWEGTLRIADFGLARRMETDERRTETGEILGTPNYMAPEQASGVVREIGPAADIHAIGAILYECVTGRPPYLGSDPVQTLMLLLTTDPVPPRVLQPRLSRDLETIILKALAKSPASRYASAAALADDLRRWLDDLPITARRTPATVRAWRWIRRHPAISTTIGLIFLSVSAFVLFQQLAAQRLRAANVRAERLLDVVNQAIPDLELTDAAQRRADERARLETAVATLDEFVAQLGPTDPMFARAEQIRIKYLVGLAADAEWTGDVERERRFVDELEQAIERYPTIDQDDFDALDFRLWAGRMASLHRDRLGDQTGSIEQLERNLESIARRTAETTDPERRRQLLIRRIEALNSLGVSYSTLADRTAADGDSAAAERLAERATAAFEERWETSRAPELADLEAQAPLQADAAVALGVRYGLSGRFDEAVDLLEKGVATLERLVETRGTFALRVDLIHAESQAILFRNLRGESPAAFAERGERLEAMLERAAPELAAAPEAVDRIITGFYIAGGIRQAAGDDERAVALFDTALRWGAFRMARVSPENANLPLLMAIDGMRQGSFATLGTPPKVPRFDVDITDPLASSEVGFLLAFLGDRAGLDAWSEEFRRRFPDDDARARLKRIESLAEAMAGERGEGAAPNVSPDESPE